MEKVKEYITSEKGFFKSFQASRGEDYTALLGNYNPKDLDLTLLILGGERYASPLIKRDNLEDVVTFILLNNLERWLKLKEILSLNYNVLNPYEHKKTTTQEKTGENINTFQESEKTAVHTFDSSEAIDKNLDTTENTDKTTESENLKVVVETSGNNGNIPITQLINEEMKLRQTQLINVVVKDVLKEISLEIY